VISTGRLLHPALRALLCCATLPSTAIAASLPDWAAATAETAPEVPPGPPNTPSRVLYSEVRTAVQTDGTLRIRRRFALQALSVETDTVSTGWYPFGDTTKVTAVRAWHLPPHERAKKSRSIPVDVAVGDAFLSGSKVRLLEVEGVKKGSLVFYEFEAIEKPYFLSLSHLFYEGAPVDRARFELETPPGWSVRSVWLRHPGPDPRVAGTLRSWELRGLSAPEEERLAPDAADEAPLLGINLSPPPEIRVAPATFSDWSSVSRWYSDLSRGRADVTPAVETAVRQAISSLGTSPAEILLSAGTMVRDRVRYVAVELGLAGFRPRPAGETLAKLYGDCKDKGTLLQAALAAEGISSYPVLINLGGAKTVPQDPPVWGFNHFIVAAAVPPGQNLPDRFTSAQMTDPDLGRLVLIDPTSDTTSIGSLPAALAGQTGLVAAGMRGKLITLPAGNPSDHQLQRHLVGRLGDDGDLHMVRESRFTGELAAEVRSEENRSSRDRREAVEGAILHRWPDAVVEDYSIQPETSDGWFAEKLSFRHGYSSASGDASDSGVELFPGAADAFERVPLGRRKGAVDYGFPQLVRYETMLEGVPQDAALPESESLQGNGWSIKTYYSREGTSLKASWEVQLSRRRFEATEFAELRKFWSSLSASAGWRVPLSQ